jgi:hypothetical protein
MLLSSSLFAQSKEFKSGVASEGNYLVKEGFKKVYSPNKVRDYLEGKGYTVIEIKSEEVAKYGNIVDKVSYAKYITPESLVREEERRRYANEQSTIAAVVMLGIAGKIVAGTVKSIQESKNSDAPSGYNNYYNDDKTTYSNPSEKKDNRTSSKLSNTNSIRIDIGTFKKQVGSGKNTFAQVKIICVSTKEILRQFELANYPNESKPYQLSGISKWENLEEFKKTTWWHVKHGSYGSCD